jgi:cytochrome c peroxidase
VLFGCCGFLGCTARVDGRDADVDEHVATTREAVTAAALSTAVFPDPTGLTESLSTLGPVIADNPFFASLGSNGRACVTCHVPDDGWTVSASHVQARFTASGGSDPIFRLVDGANSPDADDSDPASYSMLLDHGVIRVELAPPPGAEFAVVDVFDPYGHATARGLSLFRRPRPATNLSFGGSVMWDGREPNLASQANHATVGHAQGTPPPAEILASIVEFESSLFSAQRVDFDFGFLSPTGTAPVRTLIDQNIDTGPFDLFDAWQNVAASNAQQTIAIGQALFNGKAGCIACHDGKNTGAGSAPIFLDIGTSRAALREGDFPVYTLQNLRTGQRVQTSDPGRALVTGSWSDVDAFKVPVIRDLAARAPYFHNGLASTIEEVVQFYNVTRSLNLTVPERRALAAFLYAL